MMKKLLKLPLILLGIVIFYLNWAGVLPGLAFMNTDWGTLLGMSS